MFLLTNTSSNSGISLELRCLSQIQIERFCLFSIFSCSNTNIQVNFQWNTKGEGKKLTNVQQTLNDEGTTTRLPHFVSKFHIFVVHQYCPIECSIRKARSISSQWAWYSLTNLHGLISNRSNENHRDHNHLARLKNKPTTSPTQDQGVYRKWKMEIHASSMIFPPRCPKLFSTIIMFGQFFSKWFPPI